MTFSEESESAPLVEQTQVPEKADYIIDLCVLAPFITVGIFVGWGIAAIAPDIFSLAVLDLVATLVMGFAALFISFYIKEKKYGTDS